MDGSFEPCKGQRVCWTAVSSLGHAQHDKRYVTFNYNPGQNVWDTVFQEKKMHFKLTPPPQPRLWVSIACLLQIPFKNTSNSGCVPKPFGQDCTYPTALWSPVQTDARSCCALLHVARLTGLNFAHQLPTARNNMQQGVQTDATRNIQQCLSFC